MLTVVMLSAIGGITIASLTWWQTQQRRAQRRREIDRLEAKLNREREEAR